MRILGALGAFPDHRYSQHEITDAFLDVVLREPANRPLVQRIHGNAGVDTRHLVMPLEDYGSLRDFGEANDMFIEAGTELGARAVTDVLKQVGLTPEDVDVIVSATVTGLAVPTLEARVASRIGMRPDVRRMPLVGLGCVAGAAGIARLHDYLLGHPDHVGVLMSVELCSLTVQHDDTSMPNIVAGGLFGDGAAAVVAVGSERAGDLAPDVAGSTPEVLDSVSHLYPDSERTMGWDVGSTGLRIVLDAQVPTLVEAYLGEDVDRFLARHGLGRSDIEWWVSHPGGPKVLEAMQSALGLDRSALQVTWDSLAAVGNLSSASVLNVLADTLRDRPPRPGSYGLMLAMGPGFCSELVLLRAPAEG
jgi:alkylresorcinol/alkylpyrone synthase